MAERKKTPDILADLLGDKSLSDKSQETISETPDEKQQNSLMAKLKDVLPVKQQAVKTVNQLGSESTITPLSVAQDALAQDANDEEEGGSTTKLKVTFYLSEDSVDLLEEAQRKLRRMSRSAGKTQSKALTSKSALLEEALKLACADLDAAGTQSHLARILA